MRAPAIVAIGFTVVVIVVTVVGYFMSQIIGTPEEQCRNLCAEGNRSGRLVFVYPSEQTAGMRGKGPANCECY